MRIRGPSGKTYDATARLLELESGHAKAPPPTDYTIFPPVRDIAVLKEFLEDTYAGYIARAHYTHRINRVEFEVTAYQHYRYDYPSIVIQGELLDGAGPIPNLREMANLQMEDIALRYEEDLKL